MTSDRPTESAAAGYLPLFHQPAWLAAVTGNSWQEVRTLEALPLPYHRIHRWGTTVIAHPPLTPFLYLRHPVSQDEPSLRAVGELLDQLPAYTKAHLLLGYNFDAWLPFYRRGWTCKLRYSYQLDLTTAPAQRLAAYKYSLRRTVKRAPAGIRVAPLPLAGAHARFEAHLRRRGSSTGVSDGQFAQLYTHFHPTGQFQLWGLHHEDQLLASLCLAIDNGTAYCLLTERDTRLDTIQAMHLLYHHVIERCARAGLSTFDFNGSMLPGVEPFMRAYGGVRRTKYELIHFGNRFWRAGFALLGKGV